MLVLLHGAPSPAADELTVPALPTVLRDLSDVGGGRSALEQRGVRFTFTYYGDGFANPSGGVRQGVGFDGRFGTIIDADLAKLVGWSGATAHASIHDIFGTQFSARNLANLMSVSGIEAPPSLRLFNLWIEQAIGSKLNLRVGQFTAAQEFMTSDTANLFVNSTFGWPTSFAQDLPSGGPAYPEATPGVRLSFAATDAFTLRAAVFNGDPAGPGPGNPVQRDPLGLALRVNDPPFLIVEGISAWGEAPPAHRRAVNPNQEGTDAGGRRGSPDQQGGLPGSLKLGAWYHSGSFADQRTDINGQLLAADAGAPLQHRGNWSFYAVLDQDLWQMPNDGSRRLSGLLRASVSPADRNLVDLYVDGGMTFKGALPQRSDDIIGLALAYGRISSAAREASRDVAVLSHGAGPIRDYELALELTYQWKLADNWTLQPDLQYIGHPGGHAPTAAPAAVGAAAIPDALVFGLRSFLKF
ncbi:carbohydrate porin [Bradyrhizobium sp. ORS 375]|uniref:carbohydrate porin n=1 Tax=Bradyrhizobium sp. (strain ORS 375) TaxID=566679 RepID=UPI00030BB2E2|nr:carbohydrate porin [Bradyrhizobium sp. ORS 375]